MGIFRFFRHQPVQGKPFIGIEIKNFHYKKKAYSIDWLNEDVFPRFKTDLNEFPIKVLAISFKDCVSNIALEICEQKNLNVYGLGFLVTEQNLYSRETQFYSKLAELKQFIEQIESKSFFGVSKKV